MEENPLLWQKPASRRAVKEILWKLNVRLADHIDLKIFQDKEHLENFLGCSRTITSAIERLGLVAINEFNRESEPQSKVVANAEASSIEQASNPAGMFPRDSEVILPSQQELQWYSELILYKQGWASIKKRAPFRIII